MTQEQNEKLEQKAKDYIKPFAHQLHLGADEGLIMDLVGFAQTILDNPGEWGLTENKNLHDTLKSTVVESENKDRRINLMTAKIEGLKSQLTKYREALEQLKEMHSDQEFTCILIEEALKQEDAK